MSASPSADDAVVVLCTAPEQAPEGRLAAAALAQRLVEERLCACVHSIRNIASCYRWQGQVEHGVETLLIVKTTRALLPVLRDRIAALHPYEVPEFLVLPVEGGLSTYLDWIRASVAGAEP